MYYINVLWFITEKIHLIIHFGSRSSQSVVFIFALVVLIGNLVK